MPGLAYDHNAIRQQKLLEKFLRGNSREKEYLSNNANETTNAKRSRNINSNMNSNRNSEYNTINYKGTI